MQFNTWNFSREASPNVFVVANKNFSISSQRDSSVTTAMKKTCTHLQQEISFPFSGKFQSVIFPFYPGNHLAVVKLSANTVYSET